MAFHDFVVYVAHFSTDGAYEMEVISLGQLIVSLMWVECQSAQYVALA